MCPCCVLGAIFIAQILGVIRWVKRTILKQEVKPEEEYWKPESMLTPKMQALFHNKKKMAIIGGVIAAEIIAFVLLLKFDGFMFIKHFFMMLQ